MILILLPWPLLVQWPKTTLFVSPSIDCLPPERVFLLSQIKVYVCVAVAKPRSVHCSTKVITATPTYNKLFNV
ncbi:hypothetical protein BDB00DRAFT_794935, partial [Zychaea mexicana]|uniref:uncharacterized protein n=1 Tax=Zychaea mexicana TaxID=64656 RepID=UPI0022FE1418